VAPENQVAVSRRIEAPAAELFAILADPRRHTELDGSGMLRGAVTETPVTGVGDVFVVRMYYLPVGGDYQMNNHVVEYQQDRLIAWEPESGKGHPAEATPEARWGQRWSYELTPEGTDATVVTHRYDCSRVSADGQAQLAGGRIWVDAMAETLRRLDERVRADRRVGEQQLA